MLEELSPTSVSGREYQLPPFLILSRRLRFLKVTEKYKTSKKFILKGMTSGVNTRSSQTEFLFTFDLGV